MSKNETESAKGARDGNKIKGQSDEIFRLLVESVQDYAIFLLNPEGKIMTWNLVAERI
jgi:hypothetical protein